MFFNETLRYYKNSFKFKTLSPYHGAAVFDEGVEVMLVGVEGGAKGVASLFGPQHALLLTAHVFIGLRPAREEHGKLLIVLQLSACWRKKKRTVH